MRAWASLARTVINGRAPMAPNICCSNEPFITGVSAKLAHAGRDSWKYGKAKHTNALRLLQR